MICSHDPPWFKPSFQAPLLLLTPFRPQAALALGSRAAAFHGRQLARLAQRASRKQKAGQRARDLLGAKAFRRFF